MVYDPIKTTWLNPGIEYLFNDEIIEYDIRDAGFSLIKEFKLLPEIQIRELERMGKGFNRHVAIGKIQRDDKIFSKALNDRFADARRAFIAGNNISDSNIVSVKKDAIFTIGSVERLKFGIVEFDKKNSYSSYIRFSSVNNLELYYHNHTFDIKGMSDISVDKHRLWMLEFLQKIVPMIESKNISVKRYMMNFIDDYKSQRLDDEYYIEFNNLSSSYNPIFNYQKIIIPLMQIITREFD